MYCHYYRKKGKIPGANLGFYFSLWGGEEGVYYLVLNSIVVLTIWQGWNKPNVYQGAPGFWGVRDLKRLENYMLRNHVLLYQRSYQNYIVT